eukprot:909293-Pelagomonas_calceolata.AAC.1
MQEQAPPDLLPLITPPEPPHLLDPAMKVTSKMVGLGRRVWRRQGGRGKGDCGAGTLVPSCMPSCPLQGELEGRHSPDREVFGGEAKVAFGGVPMEGPLAQPLAPPWPL